MKSTLFCGASGEPAYLEGMYSGASAFLVASGPSLKTYNLSELNQPGILTLGINNSPSIFRPNLWTMTDDVSSFLRSIFEDPKIIKFLPEGKTNDRLFDSTTRQHIDKRVKDCPGVFYYKRNNHFQADKYLTESTVNWGSHEDYCLCGYKRPAKPDKGKSNPVKKCPQCKTPENNWGARSVMLAAVRIMYALGIRTIFLVGCDFKMQEGKQNYAFPQDRSKGSIRGNNKTYRILNARFDALRPVFEKKGLHIYNCLESSGLKSFGYVPFNEAVQFCLEKFPDVTKENTEGLYDRKAKEKELAKLNTKVDKAGQPTLAEIAKRVKRG